MSNKAIIDSLKTYIAKVNYHRTDDLKKGAAPNGKLVSVEAQYKSERDERFPGQWMFDVRGHRGMLPESDLIILEEAVSNYEVVEEFEYN